MQSTGSVYILRDFVTSDYTEMETNEFTTSDYLEEIINHGGFERRTLLRNGKAEALIMFRQLAESNNPNDWYGLFVVSKHFHFRSAKVLREAIYSLMDEFKADMVWTASRCGATMERWHKFLRMERYEAPREIDGRMCQIWRLTHGY